MSVITQCEAEGIRLRPEVKKHYDYFRRAVLQYGAEVVKKVLDRGYYKGVKLDFLKNKKDRYQMAQLLDLV